MGSQDALFSEPQAFGDFLRREVEARLRRFGPDRAGFRRAQEEAALRVGDVSVHARDDDIDIVIDFSLAGRPLCRYRFVFPGVWQKALAEEDTLPPNWRATSGIGADTAFGYVTYLHTFFDEQLNAGDLGLPECDESQVTLITYDW